MKNIIISSLVASSVAFAQMPADNRVPLAGVAGGEGMVFPEGKLRFVVKNISKTKDEAYNGDTKVEDKSKREMKVNMTKLLIRYGLGNNFGIRTIIPYVKKENGVSHPISGQRFTNDNSGIGDIKLLGRYQLLNQKKGDPLFLALGVGVKLPTGDTNKDINTPAGTSKVPTMQLGSGSTDYLAEIGFSRLLANSRIDGHMLYSIKNKGDNNYEFGNKLIWNLGYSYALTKQFDLALTLHGTSEDKHKSNGKDVNETGGTFTYLSPSVHYKINKKFDISASYSVMIDRNNNYNSTTSVGGLSEDSIFIVRLGYNF